MTLFAGLKTFITRLQTCLHSSDGRCRNCGRLCQFDGRIVSNDKAATDRPALEVIGEFATCAAKANWIALVLTGDEKMAARALSSGINDVDNSRTVFGDWLCSWSMRDVILACAALRAEELRTEAGSGEYWRAKTVEGSTVKMQLAPLSIERLRRAVLLLPFFPRFVYVLQVLEGYSLSYVASIVHVDQEACRAALDYSFGALAEASLPVQPAKRQCVQSP